MRHERTARESARAADVVGQDLSSSTYRELAAARLDKFRPKLASSLGVLAHVVGAVGRPEKELAARQEAVGVYRELAAARPEEFRDDLVGSLNDLSAELARLGRREKALAASQEADTIRAELASRQPDT
jgi:hypothetical protein